MQSDEQRTSGAYTRQDMLWWGGLLLVVGGVLGAGITRFVVTPPAGSEPGLWN